MILFLDSGLKEIVSNGTDQIQLAADEKLSLLESLIQKSEKNLTQNTNYSRYTLF